MQRLEQRNKEKRGKQIKSEHTLFHKENENYNHGGVEILQAHAPTSSYEEEHP